MSQPPTFWCSNVVKQICLHRSTETGEQNTKSGEQSTKINPQKSGFSDLAQVPVLKLPDVNGQNLDDFINDLGRWLRLSGVSEEPDEV